MPVDFTIIPNRGLVVVRFTGHATIDEMLVATKAYLAHPDYCAGQKQIVDMAHVTGFEHDYVRFMNIQAAKAERLAGAGVQSLAVYVAPTKVSREISAMFTRTWDDIDEVVALVQRSEAKALALLGQSEKSIDEMLATIA